MSTQFVVNSMAIHVFVQAQYVLITFILYFTFRIYFVLQGSLFSPAHCDDHKFEPRSWSADVLAAAGTPCPVHFSTCMSVVHDVA